MIHTRSKWQITNEILDNYSLPGTLQSPPPLLIEEMGDLLEFGGNIHISSLPELIQLLTTLVQEADPQSVGGWRVDTGSNEVE